MSVMLGVGGLLAMQVAVAADPPGSDGIAAQELLRQQERERALREERERTPDVRLPRPAPAPQLDDAAVPDLPCMPIDRIVLRGDDAARFMFALHAAGVASPAGGASRRCLGARGVNALLQRVQTAILDRGFVTTRVVATPQDLTTGELALTVVAGRIHAIQVDDGGSGRATAWSALPARPGDLLNLRDIEQGLENFKRVPTVEADIQIVPTDAPGESDLRIVWTQAFPFRLNLAVDDAGSRATGKTQGTATVSYDNWWTLSDLLYLTVSRGLGGGSSRTRGSDGTVLHYSVPFGDWLLGATGSRNGYRQSVAGLNQTYVYSGTSGTAELRLSRMVYRDAVRKTTVSASGWTRSSNNFIDDTEVEVQRRRMAGWELGAAHREFIGLATLDLDLAWRRGTGAWGSLPAPEEAFGDGTARPRLLTADARFDLPWSVAGQRLRYAAAWRAQWNHTPLVPQDRFSIGNRYTVRGFDGETTLSAERGWLVRNDLGWSLPAIGAEAYLGLDHGEVDGPAAGRLLGRRLTGGAAGLRGGAGRLGYDVFVGAPIARPAGYPTARVTAGFAANCSF